MSKTNPVADDSSVPDGYYYAKKLPKCKDRVTMNELEKFFEDGEPDPVRGEAHDPEPHYNQWYEEGRKSAQIELGYDVHGFARNPYVGGTVAHADFNLGYHDTLNEYENLPESVIEATMEQSHNQMIVDEFNRLRFEGKVEISADFFGIHSITLKGE